MSNIFLTGFMGTGKSTVSRYLNRHFYMESVDTDQVIAERTGMGIPEIFAVYGEEYFRGLETEILREMQSRRNVVISCGGGAVLRAQNVEEMKKSGIVVLLTASPETVLKRVKDSEDRPLLNGNKNVEFIRELMEQRREKYEAAADVAVQTDGKTAAEICEEIMRFQGRKEDE